MSLEALTLLVLACARGRIVDVPVQVTQTPTSPPVTFSPRTLTVLVEAGQDTAVIRDFLLSTILVRVGDPVTWKYNGDPAADADPSTVTFTQQTVQVRQSRFQPQGAVVVAFRALTCPFRTSLSQCLKVVRTTGCSTPA